MCRVLQSFSLILLPASYTSKSYWRRARVICREGLTFTDLCLDFQEERLKECIRSEFPKNSEVTRTKISERCKIPWQTVDNHYDDIIEKDLGDGTKLVRGKACYDAVIRDPPGEQLVAIKVATPKDRPSKSNAREDFVVGAIAGGLVVTSLALIHLALRDRSHICRWATVPGADSWVRACAVCGAKTMSLNDQSAPIHFAPCNS